VLFGPDVIADVVVHPTYYRALVEHELRSKLLRLRQQGAGMLSESENLLAVCVESVSTFCMLGRHALLVAGVESKRERRGVVRQLGEHLRVDMGAFETLLDIREEKPGANPGDPAELFARYLVSIGKLVEFVNALEKHQEARHV
jgi:hypothetical protein